MYILSIEDIKEFTNNIIFARAYKIYKGNKIKNSKIKKSKDNDGIIYKVSADIMGSSIDEVHHTEFFLGEESIVKYYCSCPSFFNYDGPCKHIVALLIAFHYNPHKAHEMEKRQILDKLINNIQGSTKILAKTKYKILMDIILCVQNDLNNPSHSLELRIGEEKKYVVKNMKTFIQCIIEKKELEFGSNFTFSSTTHYFCEEDNKIINMIKELYEFNEINVQLLKDNNESFLFKGKKVYLPESHMKRLLKILKNIKFKIKYDNGEEILGEILNEDLPLEFNIDYIEKYIVIEQISDLPLSLSKDGNYFFYNKKIYHPSMPQIELYKGLFETLKENKKIMIYDDYLKDIEKFIIPAIKKVSKQVNIDDKLKKYLI